MARKRKTAKPGNSGQKEFIRKFDTLCTVESPWSVWNDFITTSALTFANALEQQGDIHDRREAEHLGITSRYKPEEQEIFPELMALLVQNLEENPEQDFLGKIFMLLGFGDSRKEQYFTPYEVARLMTKLTVREPEKQIAKRGWISIGDCCCGAGALLIASRNEMMKRGFNYRQVLYVAQDIDRTAALMCYLQLSLLGCAGYVVVGNSLSEPVSGLSHSLLLPQTAPGQEIWFTPMFYDPVWQRRIAFERLKLLLGWSYKT